jgi:hypothetical protein
MAHTVADPLHMSVPSEYNEENDEDDYDELLEQIACNSEFIKSQIPESEKEAYLKRKTCLLSNEV